MPAAVITRGDVERELLAELVAGELGPVALVNNLPDDYEGWLRRLFPEWLTDASGRTIPLAEHHHEFWRWVWAVEKGARPEPFVAIWPRGGGKSTSVELACVALGARRARRYVLYVCNTQAQADDHVQNIGALLESTAVEAAYPDMASRAVGKYGSSKGWRRNRLRTERGFVVDAIGLDTAARGVKLDDARPDLIVFDDVDDAADTPLTTQKKIVAITQKLLPAGSSDAAALAVQNLVHHEGVFARLAGLASEPADFLADRIVSGPHPAVRGLVVEKSPAGRWLIVKGAPTWEGQDLDTCQRQVNDWGIRAFRAEAQHERTPPVGQAFPEWDASVHTCDAFPVPDEWPRWRAVDYGYAVPFCCLWLARRPDGAFVVYRELYGSGLTAAEQALQVRALSAGEVYKASVGDPAMWASNREGRRFKSVSDQYREMGVPLTRATNERLAGKERVHQYLDWDEPSDGREGYPPRLVVFKTCANLIRTMPLLVKDPNDPEDVDTDTEDHCLVGNTLIETEHGPVPIAELVGKSGRLYTHDGRLVPFFDVRPTRAEASIVTVTMTDGRSVTCTDDHRLMTAEGEWLEARALTPGRMMHSVILPTWTRSAFPTRSKSFRASVTTFAAGISSAVASAFMWLSGRRPMEKSRTDTISTTAITTERITASATWKLNLAVDTLVSILQVLARPNAQPAARTSSGPLLATAGSHPNSVHLPRGRDGSSPTLRQLRAECAEPSCSPHSHQEPSSAAARAKPAHCVVAAVTPAGRARVYDLAVEDPSHALAVNGGIVVHNCYDALRYGLMAASLNQRLGGAIARAMSGRPVGPDVHRLGPGVGNVSERRREQDEQEARRRPVRRPGLLSGTRR